MIGLILGTGNLPCQIVKELQKKQTNFTCVLLENFINTSIINLTDKYCIVKMGHIGKTINHLKQHGVTHIVFAGHIARPSFKDLDTDAKGRSWLIKLGLSIFKGDDGLLVALTDLLKSEGFKMMTPNDILNSLYLKKGVHTNIQPSEQDNLDIKKGIEILNTTSPLDIGQAIIIEDGVVLGLEAIEGTEKLIQRIKTLKRTKKNSGVLVKMAKQQQSKEVDLPTVGPDTIQQCIESGLKGIAIDHQYTQVLDQSRVIQLANDNNLYVKAF